MAFPSEISRNNAMKVFSFTFYANVQEDAQGRNTGYMDGYKEGDDLQIAYRGFVDVDSTYQGRQRLESVAHALYARFNNPDLRPEGYRGPSMSLGSVLEIQGVHFAVAPLDFTEVKIWQSRIYPKDARWTVGEPRDNAVLALEPIRKVTQHLEVQL
jgi:hypothetical protein